MIDHERYEGREEQAKRDKRLVRNFLLAVVVVASAIAATVYFLHH